MNRSVELNNPDSLNPASVLGIGLLLFLFAPLFNRDASAQSAGALGNGLSAASISRGGTMVAEQGDPLEAVEGNPAGLAGIRGRIVDLDALALFAQGKFSNSVDSDGRLRPFAGTLPYGAIGSSIGRSRFTAAAAVTPEFLMRAAWHYTDPPGTADVSYGFQKNESQFVAVRGSTTLAFAPSPRWSFGAGLGLVYNSNTLHAPYIFQQQPQLAGLKVLLDLNTRGFGWNGNAGVQWQPNDRLRLGAAWKSPTFVPSHGDANGSASALFPALGVGANPSFHYGAEVDNHLPQTVAAGLRWQESRRVRLAFEGGWSDWSNAFNVLPVKLKDGTNAVINSVAGSAAIRDGIPLHWRDQESFRAGVEVPVRQWTARAGYSFLSNPGAQLNDHPADCGDPEQRACHRFRLAARVLGQPSAAGTLFLGMGRRLPGAAACIGERRAEFAQGGRVQQHVDSRDDAVGDRIRTAYVLARERSGNFAGIDLM